MAHRVTDPGLGGSATDPSDPPDAAITDPMSGTYPPARDGAAASESFADDENIEPSDGLLEGLRRDRPPPRLAPRINAASEGGEAVAYYAGPQSLPTRFDTPPLEPAIEIQTTPNATTTEPLPTVRRSVTLEPKASVATEPRAPVLNHVVVPRAPLEPTVSTRKRRVPSRILALGLLVFIFGSGLVLWYALRMGSTPTVDPPASLSSLSSAPPAPQRSATPVASATAPIPIVVPPSPTTTSSAPGRIEATPASPRPTAHPPATTVAPAISPARPVAPFTAPSSEPSHVPPASVPSAKIDHVRTI